MDHNHPVVESIRHSLTKNGFPGKSVKLPFRPVFDSCRRHGAALAEVLTLLGTEDIIATLTGDHILFQTPEKALEWAEQKRKSTPAASGNPLALLAHIPGGMEHLARFTGKAVGPLSPEQTEMLKKGIESMSPADKMNLLNFYSNLFKDPKSK